MAVVAHQSQQAVTVVRRDLDVDCARPYGPCSLTPPEESSPLGFSAKTFAWSLRGTPVPEKRCVLPAGAGWGLAPLAVLLAFGGFRRRGRL